MKIILIKLLAFSVPFLVETASNNAKKRKARDWDLYQPRPYQRRLFNDQEFSNLTISDPHETAVHNVESSLHNADDLNTRISFLCDNLNALNLKDVSTLVREMRLTESQSILLEQFNNNLHSCNFSGDINKLRNVAQALIDVPEPELRSLDVKLSALLKGLNGERIPPNLCTDLSTNTRLVFKLSSWEPYINGDESHEIQQTLINLYFQSDPNQDQSPALTNLMRDPLIVQSQWPIREMINESLSPVVLNSGFGPTLRFIVKCLFKLNPKLCLIYIAKSLVITRRLDITDSDLKLYVEKFYSLHFPNPVYVPELRVIINQMTKVIEGGLPRKMSSFEINTTN